MLGETSGGIQNYINLNVTICGLETLVVANSSIEDIVLSKGNSSSLNEITWTKLTGFFNFSESGGSHVECGISTYTLWKDAACTVAWTENEKAELIYDPATKEYKISLKSTSSYSE